MTSLPSGASVTERENFGRVLTLSTHDSRVEIALYGATVLSYTANPSEEGSKPVLWLSKNTSGANGKAIRGGVPLCAPWFGPHPTAAGTPSHGLVRISEWTLERVEEISETLRATLTLDLPRDTERGWNHNASATFVVTAGEALSMELTVRNMGPSSFLLSEAMHTYFSVSNVRNVRVEGLNDTEYLAFAGDGKRHTHGASALTLTGEAAHMFYTGRPVRLIDENWKRAIYIQGYGAANTVVWNPWEKTAAKTGDILDQWPEFICVENANIPDSALPLPPNTSHHMGTTISVSAL